MTCKSFKHIYEQKTCLWNTLPTARWWGQGSNQGGQCWRNKHTKPDHCTLQRSKTIRQGLKFTGRHTYRQMDRHEAICSQLYLTQGDIKTCTCMYTYIWKQDINQFNQASQVIHLFRFWAGQSFPQLTCPYKSTEDCFISNTDLRYT